MDIIIANGVLNNAKHIDSTFEKMINLVRPGGKIFFRNTGFSGIYDGGY